MHDRLVRRDPVHRALERVHRRERMHRRVGHDADRMRAGAERDQPQPVAGAAEVVRRHPARRRRAARAPRRVGDPVVDAEPFGEPEPDGVALRGRCPPRGRACASAARRGPTRRSASRRVIVSRTPSRSTSTRVTARGRRRCAAPSSRRRSARRAAPPPSARKFSNTPRSICHDGVDMKRLAPSSVTSARSRSPSEKKKRKPNLRRCWSSRCARQAERLGEVVRADLDARLADLVRGGRRRMRAALDDAHVERRHRVLQLQRERQAGEPAARDQDVVMRTRRRGRGGLRMRHGGLAAGAGDTARGPAYPIGAASEGGPSTSMRSDTAAPIG